MLDLRISKTKFGIQHEAFEAKSTLFVVFLFNSMPVRLGKARLWFNTKEEQVLTKLLRMSTMTTSSPTLSLPLMMKLTITTA